MTGEGRAEDTFVLAPIVIDQHLTLRALNSLHWHRWFMGLIGPRCTEAADLLEAISFLFLVSSAIGRRLQKPDHGIEREPGASEIIERVGRTVERADDLNELFPDLLTDIALAANVPASTVSGALNSDRGRAALRGTKVPKNTALSLASQKVDEGLYYGLEYPGLAQSMAVNHLDLVNSCMQLQRSATVASAEQFADELWSAYTEWTRALPSAES